MIIIIPYMELIGVDEVITAAAESVVAAAASIHPRLLMNITTLPVLLRTNLT